jgi:predicted xylose isomerase-like sugar epimerase
MHSVIDHNSFTKTIENIFSLSFLVQQSKVKLKRDQNGIKIETTNKQEEIKRDTKKQGVIKFNLAMYQNMIKKN